MNVQLDQPLHHTLHPLISCLQDKFTKSSTVNFRSTINAQILTWNGKSLFSPLVLPDQKAFRKNHWLGFSLAIRQSRFAKTKWERKTNMTSLNCFIYLAPHILYMALQANIVQLHQWLLQKHSKISETPKLFKLLHPSSLILLQFFGFCQKHFKSSCTSMTEGKSKLGLITEWMEKDVACNWSKKMEITPD